MDDCRQSVILYIYHTCAEISLVKQAGSASAHPRLLKNLFINKKSFLCMIIHVQCTFLADGNQSHQTLSRFGTSLIHTKKHCSSFWPYSTLNLVSFLHFLKLDSLPSSNVVERLCRFVENPIDEARNAIRQDLKSGPINE